MVRPRQRLPAMRNSWVVRRPRPAPKNPTYSRIHTNTEFTSRLPTAIPRTACYHPSHRPKSLASPAPQILLGFLQSKKNKKNRFPLLSHLFCIISHFPCIHPPFQKTHKRTRARRVATFQASDAHPQLYQIIRILKNKFLTILSEYFKITNRPEHSPRPHAYVGAGRQKMDTIGPVVHRPPPNGGPHSVSRFDRVFPMYRRIRVWDPQDSRAPFCAGFHACSTVSIPGPDLLS